MEFNTVKALLKKITEFVDSLEKNGSKILPIEEELLKGYALELYRNIGHSDNTSIEAVLEKIKPIVKKEESKPLTIIKEAPKSVKPQPELIVEETKISEKESTESLKEKLEKSTELHVEKKQTQAEKSKPKAEVKKQPKAVPAKNSGHSMDLNEMFAFEEAKDLAERLSQSPVTDLNASMGINEKIFTINELFGGDSARFGKCVEKLHAAKNMDEAKRFLIKGIAKEQNWTDASRIKKATNFIKLVRRLYQ